MSLIVSTDHVFSLPCSSRMCQRTVGFTRIQVFFLFSSSNSCVLSSFTVFAWHSRSRNRGLQSPTTVRNASVDFVATLFSYSCSRRNSCQVLLALAPASVEPLSTRPRRLCQRRSLTLSLSLNCTAMTGTAGVVPSLGMCLFISSRPQDHPFPSCIVLSRGSTRQL